MRSNADSERSRINSSPPGEKLEGSGGHGSHYNPNQPRVPAGNQGGGQWTSGNTWAGQPLIRLAGEPPIGELPPEIPRKRPRTRKERLRIARLVPKLFLRLGPNRAIILAIEGVGWLREYYPEIRSALDPSKTLKELQQDLLNPKKGYDVHHIVERASAYEDGFPKSQIDAPENLVCVPRWKHWDINGWFQTRNKIYGNRSPRDYLRRKNWERKKAIGLKALKQFGVLKP